MVTRIDVLPILLEARRVFVAEVLGGCFGQAQLGRWWLPCDLLREGEQPREAAARILEDQLGLVLEELQVVGTRQHQVGAGWHLALVMAGAVSGGEPDPRPPASGYSARLLAELPDQTGFYHRDEIALLASRYEKLRG
ncbi:MAG TPA: NUDIX domain-containing protein [Anaeromyxobacteraceae bacterium]|jgi:ADP-ribose pyrophosphatase YjhB (NUDIX family)|nr:NUDIX domain-containing protein [Anaeromyxobacteraceae bacterium]